MSKSLELPDATYDAIVARAAERGITPEELVVRYFGPPDRREQSAPLPGQTLYDRLKDFIGCVEGTNPDASKDPGEQFTDYLEEKRREGRL